jgi:hypothetical protein
MGKGLHWTLNLTIETCTSTSHDELENEGHIFGVGTYFESSQVLVTRELFLLKRLSIPFTTCENLFIWWHNHKGQFLDVTFLAKQILGILRSQIEIKKVFNLVGVLKILGWKHITMVKDCCHKYYFLKLPVFELLPS